MAEISDERIAELRVEWCVPWERMEGAALRKINRLLKQRDVALALLDALTAERTARARMEGALRAIEPVIAAVAAAELDDAAPPRIKLSDGSIVTGEIAELVESLCEALLGIGDVARRALQGGDEG